MSEFKQIDVRHKSLINDMAKEISLTPDPNTAATKCVDIVAKWLIAPATDLALPEQMQYSTHATALLLRLGAPLED